MLALKTRAFQWSALAVLSVSVWLAGCGSQGATAPSEGAVGTGSISGTLHFYTSQPDTDANKLVQAFKTKYPGVQVDVFRSGTEEVIARLNTEAQAGSLGADVMLLADAPTFEALKKKDS
ncbi:hypothetical protein [Kyrpidia spormannii]|uniref:Extracellular solute-binding protein family 1 n=1 Tax=Kyrpidia spormannii TaxID=2055160 RepID=A0A6F9EHI9_9BACL